MKKCITTILLMAFILSLVGCSKEPITEESKTTTTSSITSTEKVEKNKEYYQNFVLASLEKGNDDVIGGIPGGYRNFCSGKLILLGKAKSLC